MSDIDFDELDKAVNSLVGDDQADKKESSPQISSDDNTSNSTTSKVGPALASRRSSGRFMDMKHDSSDMQKKDSSLLGATKTSITPLNPGVTAEDIPAKKKDNSGSSEKSDWPDPIESVKNDKDDEKPLASSSTDMPDPLDHVTVDTSKKDYLKDDDVKSEEVVKDSKPSTDEPEIDYEETDDKKDDKKESPFIDDAKVEKRPLGGFSDESPVLPPSSNKKKDDEVATDKEESQAPPQPIELPPELDKDLVAIEAGEALEVQDPDPKEEDKTEKTETDDTSDKKKKSDQKEKVSELLASAATGSIPDQYKRENRSHELHAPHPLFDDDHYKGDIKNTTSKPPKSLAAKIFQWILIGVGILLLSVFLGASFFVFASGQ